MTELGDFIDELLVIAPAIGAILESRGEDVRPDLEIPTPWAGSGPESRAYLDTWDQFTMGRSTLDGSWTPPPPGSA